MKILLVTEDLPVTHLGGAGKHAVLLGNTLLQAGHHVEMLGRKRATGVDTANGFDGVLHADIDFAHTGWQEQAFGVFNPLSRLHKARRIWQAIRRLGLKWDVIHYHGHVPILGALVPEGVNFVHTLHDQGAECITKIRFRDDAPCGLRDPVACAACATVRPNMIQEAISTMAVRSLRKSARNAFIRHQAIFVSQFLETRFRNATGPAPLRTTVIHNFIDTAQMRRTLGQVEPEDPNRSRPRVLLAGRIDRAKGFGAFLDMIPDTLLDKLDVVIAGDGPDVASLRARHGVRRVTFLGWQELDAVLQATARADACVVPSICEESCGTTILEALSLGRPVYALRRGGTPELAIYEQRQGQLRLFDDMSELVAALADTACIEPPCNVSEYADVSQRLPQILDVYSAGREASCSAGVRKEV